MKLSDTSRFLLTAGTDGITDKTLNKCGISNAHAFSILSVLELTDNKDQVH